MCTVDKKAKNLAIKQLKRLLQQLGQESSIEVTTNLAWYYQRYREILSPLGIPKLRTPNNRRLKAYVEFFNILENSIYHLQTPTYTYIGPSEGYVEYVE